MIPSYLNPFHVTDEYQQRLQDCARNMHARDVPRGSMLRQRLGQLVIRLGERVHGRHTGGFGVDDELTPARGIASEVVT